MSRLVRAIRPSAWCPDDRNEAALSGDRNSPDRAFNLALHRRTEIVGNSSNAARPAAVTLVPKERHLSNASLVSAPPCIARLRIVRPRPSRRSGVGA